MNFTVMPDYNKPHCFKCNKKICTPLSVFCNKKNNYIFISNKNGSGLCKNIVILQYSVLYKYYIDLKRGVSLWMVPLKSSHIFCFKLWTCSVCIVNITIRLFGVYTWFTLLFLDEKVGIVFKHEVIRESLRIHKNLNKKFKSFGKEWQDRASRRKHNSTGKIDGKKVFSGIKLAQYFYDWKR